MKIIFLLLPLLLFLTNCKETQTEPKSDQAGHAEIERSTEQPNPNPVKPMGKSALELLRHQISLPPENRPPLTSLSFTNSALSRSEADEALHLILADRILTLREQRQKEHDKKSITIGDKTLKYAYLTYGKKPADGHSLYISMHGGGGAPAAVNDQQWKNQIKLYQPAEGIYLAPRAPTNTWDLWHQSHIDPLFDRLIENFITFEAINPNKVYIMGYSAGGDGTYQLAPRMADRWAGAAMMAGHPGDAQAYNLRNLAYFIQCGGKDYAYNRNKLAAKWGNQLDLLAKQDPGGYPHKYIIYPQYGHWMNLKCKQAIPWMAKHTRNPWPKKLHWHQDNVTNTRFFWLANPDPKPNQLITAEVKGQTITLTRGKMHQSTFISQDSSETKDFTPLPAITLRLSDQLLDLDQPITVRDSQGNILHQGDVPRTIKAIYQSIQQRPDPTSTATATLTISLE